jgi:GNAT superfamily N-acetyltransferase
MTTMATTAAVRTVTRADGPAVTRALSGAFFDDPVFRWIYPDEGRRAGALPGFFDLFGEAIGRHGVSLAVGDGVGAALWVPPGEQVVEEPEAAGFMRALAALAPEDAERLETCFEVMEAHHPAARCWYLNLLGVRPEHQGQGIGSAMLRVALARADEAGEPAYLEATTPANRRLYERHGFAVTGELVLPDGPTMWPMWRDPAAA